MLPLKASYPEADYLLQNSIFDKTNSPLKTIQQLLISSKIKLKSIAWFIRSVSPSIIFTFYPLDPYSPIDMQTYTVSVKLNYLLSYKCNMFSFTNFANSVISVKVSISYVYYPTLLITIYLVNWNVPPPRPMPGHSEYAAVKCPPISGLLCWTCFLSCLFSLIGFLSQEPCFLF